MPFSDTAPPIVYPDTPEGRMDARRNWYDGVTPGFCPDFERDTHLSSIEAAKLRGARKGTKIDDVNLCKNRNPMGERRHNWCFRCPAGFIMVTEFDKNPVFEA